MQFQTSKIILFILISLFIGGGFYFWRSQHPALLNNSERLLKNSARPEKANNKSAHEWPSSIPSDIPALKKGAIEKVENLSTRLPVEYQPEKILFILHFSQLTDQNIKEYFADLKTNGWKAKIGTLMDGNLAYRAEKDEYTVVIEENPNGIDTAYYYVYLSEKATNAERKSAQSL